MLFATGLTITALIAGEEQPFACAEIENDVVCATPVVFVSVPEIADDVPEIPIPVRFTVLSRVQVNVVPAILFGFVIIIGVMLFPEHTVCREGVAFTAGKGFTVTEAVVVEVQVPAEMVIVKIVVCGIEVMLVRIPLIVFPLPLFPIPVRFEVLFLLQLMIAPGTEFPSVRLMVPIATPEHKVWFEGDAPAEGVGFTVINLVEVAAVQGPAPSGSFVVSVSITVPELIDGV